MNPLLTSWMLVIPGRSIGIKPVAAVIYLFATNFRRFSDLNISVIAWSDLGGNDIRYAGMVVCAKKKG
jgi:hypothetical protein